MPLLDPSMEDLPDNVMVDILSRLPVKKIVHCRLACRNHVGDTSMEDLPVEIMVNILSRLPVKTIIQCKCVCKKCRNIVLDSYFADIQLSRSPACFLIKERINYKKTGILKWVEVEEKLDHHNLHHDPFMSLDLNLTPTFQKSEIYLVGSVDGLLCLWQIGRKHDNTYICNPITREYMILPKPQYSFEVSEKIAYCFGVGSLTREYKVIRILQKYMVHDSTLCLTISEAEVYTLGTGQWRSLGHVPYWIYKWIGTFLKGHTHWILDHRNHSESLCAFDFDKETFEFFPSPPNEEGLEERFGGRYGESLGVLKGCLCLCDSYDSNSTVWVMKVYGIKNSWHKELVITRSVSLDRDLDVLSLEHVCVIEGFKDGTILMRSFGNKLIVYCPQRKTVVDTEICDCALNGFAYRPSFHRLHNFENERVSLF